MARASGDGVAILIKVALAARGFDVRLQRGRFDVGAWSFLHVPADEVSHFFRGHGGKCA